MPRMAYFQPFSGVSGDMALGALLDAGLSLTDLEAGLRLLRVEGWKLAARKEMRGAFQTTRLKVLLDEGSIAGPQHPTHHHDHENAHGHAHTHEMAHGHEHSHSHDHGPSGQRALSRILRLIGESGLPSPVQESASRVFRRIGESEAKVHGIPVEEVHFHEVGAVDSIVDIVGTCLGLHLLGIDEVGSAPITVGTGFVDVAHGKVPLPAPATLELLRGFPIEQRDSRFELTTPTGAALLTTLAKSFGTMPPLSITAIGYGAGDDRPGPVPNALRVIIGECTRGAPERDRVLVLETNIDDMSPEWTSHLLDRLFEAGALDVCLTPILMKKSRPAHEVKVIAPLAAEPAILRTLFEESTTFGVRRVEMDRVILGREMRPVETPWGVVKVKVGRLGEEMMSASPEYEDLRAAAAKASLPLKEVHARVMEIFRSRGGR